jgi:hypothetical protein
LTEIEFGLLDKYFESKFPVVYLQKVDRLKKMLFIDEHKFKTYENELLDTAGQEWAYAIGPYGNI